MASGGRAKRAVSLQRQLVLTTVLPLVLAGLLIALFSAYGLRQLALRLVLERNTALAQVAAAGMAKELDGYLNPLQVTASELAPVVRQPDRQSTVLATAAPYLARFEGGVLLLDKDGVAVATTPDHPERLGKGYAFRDYFREVQATGGPVFSPVLQEQPSGRPAVVIAVPVGMPASRPYVLAGVLFLAHHPWGADLTAPGAARDRQVYLVDGSNTVIYHPDAAQVGRRVTEPALAGMIGAKSPQSGRFGSDVSAQASVISYAPIPGTGWGLVMEEPWSAILAAANPWQWAVGVLLLVVVIVGPVLFLVSMNRVTRPLAALVEAARRVTLGQSFEPLPVRGPAEVQTLVEAFNRMVAAQEEQQATVRHYAVQVLQSQEEERKHVARELHDETVQELVGLVQRIELCRTEVVRDPPAARRRLDELQGLARQAVAGLRRMSNDLRPLLLEDLGLAAAVQTLCDESARLMPGTQVHCEIVGDARRLDPGLELTVFRVVQESLTNVRKHAQPAAHLGVTLYFESWGLLACIEDDGPGFDVQSGQAMLHAGHLGLAGMYERAHLVGAELTVSSRPGAGTTVTLRLPVAGQPPAGAGFAERAPFSLQSSHNP